MTNRAKLFQFPGGYGPEVFLESCWQIKPLLCRNALEDAGQSLTDEEILEVAIQDTSDARLISIVGGAQVVEQGPFAVDRFDVLPTSPWSLLIQSMEVWNPSLQKLRRVLDSRGIAYDRKDIEN